MNPRFIRFKSKKARPCLYCRKATKLRLSHEQVRNGKHVEVQKTCVCVVCLQALGMVAQAQNMLKEEEPS